MTLAEEHFRKRQLDLEKLTGECGTRAPPPTATSGEIGEERKRISQLVTDNRKLLMTLEQVQADLEKRAAANMELNDEIKRLKEQLAKVVDGKEERKKREEKLMNEIRVSEFRLKKARDEVTDLRGRMKEMSVTGKGDGGFEVKKENLRLKKLIGEKIIPLLRQKDEVISMYECMSRMRQESENLFTEVDKLNN